MSHWLLKTEPGVYSFDHLVRDKSTTWEGVANNAALIHLRAMKKGETALIYHTGDERAAVGLAAVTSGPYPDSSDPTGKRVVVDVKAGNRLARPVTLAEVKADPAFAGFELIRQARLSVVPVPDAMWDRIIELSKEPT